MQRSLPAGEERRQRPWARLGTMSALLLQAQLFGVKSVNSSLKAGRAWCPACLIVMGTARIGTDRNGLGGRQSC
eukprot:scaffold3146_cov18-Tisochrysis_lutea.AAC.2